MLNSVETKWKIFTGEKFSLLSRCFLKFKHPRNMDRKNIWLWVIRATPTQSISREFITNFDLEKRIYIWKLSRTEDNGSFIARWSLLSVMVIIWFNKSYCWEKILMKIRNTNFIFETIPLKVREFLRQFVFHHLVIFAFDQGYSMFWEYIY